MALESRGILNLDQTPWKKNVIRGRKKHPNLDPDPDAAPTIMRPSKNIWNLIRPLRKKGRKKNKSGCNPQEYLDPYIYEKEGRNHIYNLSFPVRF